MRSLSLTIHTKEMMGPVAAVAVSESVSVRQQTYMLNRHMKDGRVCRVEGRTHRRSISITSAGDAFDEDAYSTRTWCWSLCHSIESSICALSLSLPVFYLFDRKLAAIKEVAQTRVTGPRHMTTDSMSLLTSGYRFSIRRKHQLDDITN